MIGWLALGVYALGAAVTGVVCGVIDRLDARRLPNYEPVGPAVIVFAVVWPLVAVICVVGLVYARVVSPALDKITDAVESIVDEHRDREDDE